MEMKETKTKREKPLTKTGRRSLWRLEVSGVTNRRLVFLRKKVVHSSHDDNPM